MSNQCEIGLSYSHSADRDNETVDKFETKKWHEVVDGENS